MGCRRSPPNGMIHIRLSRCQAGNRPIEGEGSGVETDSRPNRRGIRSTNRNTTPEGCLYTSERGMTEIYFFENQFDDWFIVEVNGVMVAWEPLPQNSKRLSLTWGYWNLRSAETIYGIGVVETMEKDEQIIDRVNNLTIRQLLMTIAPPGFYDGPEDPDNENIKYNAGVLRRMKNTDTIKWLEAKGAKAKLTNSRHWTYNHFSVRCCTVQHKKDMQRKSQEKLRYFMYLRKSSDSEDRQVQSIPDQMKVLTAMTEKAGIEVEIVDTLQESRSAKAPGRPEFTRMIDRLSRGEADGIICWKLNRLARNPVDGGTISWMLQQGVIKHIWTYEKSYYPSDNVLLMAVELGLANQYVRDLSTDTKRGIHSRANEKGYPNGVAPIGFLNDLSKERGNRGWLVDEDKFGLVKQVLDLAATGRYSTRELTRISDEQMGLRTPLHKRQGGKKICLSYMAGTLLRNTVYAGFFYTKDGERHELNAEMPRMISEDQYWHIQKILGNKGRPRPSVNKDTFAYTGTASCGTCGGVVTAEHKYQLICPECKKKFAYQNKTHCPGCDIAVSKMKGPTYLHYIYYHCTKKKDPTCPEGSITEKDADKELASFFRENLSMSESLADWCAENIKILDTGEVQNEFDRKTSIEKTLATKRNEDRELFLMRSRNLLTDAELMAVREPLKAEIAALEGELAALGPVKPERLQRALRAFEVSKGIGEVFEKGSNLEKKEALTETGSNLTLTAKKLNVTNDKMYQAIIKGLLSARALNDAFEPEKCEPYKDETGTFVSVRPTLLREQDSNLQPTP